MTLTYEHLIESGDYEAALKKIFEQIEIEKNNEVHYINGGLVLYKLHKLEEAVKFLERAIKIAEDNTLAIYSLANIYYEEGKYYDARTLFLSIYDKMSEDIDLNYMIALCHVNLNEARMAIPFFEVAIKDNDDAEILFQYGVLLCQLGLLGQGESLLNRVTSLEEHADAEYNLGLVKLTRDSDLLRAKTHFETAIRIQQDHLLAHHVLKEINKQLDE
ncbi:tetratricopeptide repeat protein [Phocicoccus pinnipedialis]|uniref:TPR repeat-containing protein YrrB n=1 Tax=Phocicoccus pinnipedialis TaxID=110845 RepID=A0A6V7RG90_9BACL|nr:tetratricopeptide repeat protein [Jeotgalicoccus pinnipedialis]MBP1939224.1 tetratricopeptide (TPR) repeat protein [Jeotgalicoccus pinnipedialis]CAD2076238.1 TPR repeat-containing protein YrrB [Jeotgalicoccus pinnipedialis]